MICLRCGHYTHPDREMDREQRSADCRCPCHPGNHGYVEPKRPMTPRVAATA